MNIYTHVTRIIIIERQRKENRKTTKRIERQRKENRKKKIKRYIYSYMHN